MDRRIQYAGAIPQDTDILAAQQSAMVGLAKLSEAVLGTGPTIRGMTVIQNPVQPSLTVIVNPGEIYSVANLEATAYGSILADTTHNIVKQGLLFDPVTLTLTPPATSGYSQVYLVQVAFTEVDGNPVTLPYFNASNPTVPYSGPGNTGVAQNTTRKGRVTVQLKAGIAASTGSQVAPSADSGFTGIATVTVANGATTVVTANINNLSTAPVLQMTLPGIVSAFPGLLASGRSLGTSGYMTFPGGLILQWGATPSLAANAGASVTYPITFPNTLYAVLPVGGASSPGVGFVGVDNGAGNRSSFGIWTGSGSALPGHFIALGR